MVTGAEQHLGTVATTSGALLLIWAGAPRLRPDPDPDADPGPGPSRRRQLTGLAELACAAFVLLGPARPAAALLTALFTAFTAIHLRDLARRRTAGSCDCFGPDEQIDPRRGARLTGVMAALALAAAAAGAPSLRGLVAADPTALAWTPTAALALTLLWRIGFSGPRVLSAVADTSAGLIERRSFLLRVAVFGSALAVAPLRYALHPGTALAAVVGPWDCASGDCLDGYTGFCCEIQPGAANTCPTGTFSGGWWMCTDYSGRQLCSEQGVRYYVDCNALPGHPFPGGCRCANDNCNERRVACNIFRYGQCNTQIEGTTAVVCRMVTCENPATISELHCSASLAVDNSVCGHDVPCLEPRALELAGAAGA